ncbi:hypothetical protein [Candidatus Phyllobacterium onerii]|uniref:hypothetical protein n=1 Tax=Candidatus Phyllobacterium onerii TaxID=3020828 RepID=UPI00232E4A9E|nr:hypothetical protein [Phyllobacterium sp. IY22]
MLALLWTYRQVVAGVAAGAFLAAGPVYLYGTYQGRQQAAVAVAVETAKSYKERAEIDDKVQTLDAIALCLQLGGMPNECVIQLRGVEKDKRPVGDSRVPRRK